MWQEFKTFVARGNVIDLAVAVVIGAAFGKIVTSLVEGIIMPPIGMLLGRVDFSSLFYVLDSSKGIPVSLEEAKAKAIPVIAFGSFLNDVIGFLIIALVIFMLIKALLKPSIALKVRSLKRRRHSRRRKNFCLPIFVTSCVRSSFDKREIVI